MTRIRWGYVGQEPETNAYVDVPMMTNLVHALRYIARGTEWTGALQDEIDVNVVEGKNSLGVVERGTWGRKEVIVPRALLPSLQDGQKQARIFVLAAEINMFVGTHFGLTRPRLSREARAVSP